MFNFLITLGLNLIILLCIPSISDAAPLDMKAGPAVLIQEALSDLKKLLIKNKNPTTREVRSTIEWIFDLEETAKRSLASNWIKATQEQREQFVFYFSELLLTTYTAKLKKVNEVEIVFKNTEIRDQYAQVYSLVLEGGQEHPVIFKMKLKGDLWKIYDLVIENIGLVSNYRSEFAAIVRKEGIDGLIKKLKDKNQKS